MSRLGLGHQLVELCESPGQITLHKLCPSQSVAALTGVEPVADRVGEIAPFLTGRAGRERVAPHDRALRLRGQDLAQPPAIPYRAGQADRLAQVSAGQLEVATLAGEETARCQSPGQDRRIIDRARERQPLVGLIDALGGGHPHPQDSHVGERSSAQATSACCGVEVAERGVQQGQPFADAAPRQPQRLQRGRESQCELGIAVLAAPRKRGAQVVDLELDLGQTAPVVSTPRGVEHRGHRRVVVAVTCTHGKELTRLMVKYNIGVQVRETFELKQIDEETFEE